MGILLDDLTIAFIMRCDEEGWTLEQGIAEAESLADEIVGEAQDRSYAQREIPESD